MDLQVDCAPCRRWMFGNELESGGAVGVGSNVDPHSACAEDGGLLFISLHIVFALGGAGQFDGPAMTSGA